MTSPAHNLYRENSAEFVAEAALNKIPCLDPKISERLKWLQLRHTKYRARNGEDVILLCLTYLIQAYTNSNTLFNARGLYLRKMSVADNNDGMRWVVAMRGYDKFTSSKRICSIDDHQNQSAEEAYDDTQRYEVVVKVNGCLIMVSSICGDIFVATKNAGDLGETKGSHAVHAKVLIMKHLESVGKSKINLSDYLSSENVTFALELVDDVFEEHIVEHQSHVSGHLYLHGINENHINGRTRNMEEVSAAARKFGFLVPAYTSTSSFKEVLDICSGHVYPIDLPGFVEGYVIRTLRGDTTQFEKYKTPLYLMCREWRNIAYKCVKNQIYNFNKLKFALSYIFMFWVYDIKNKGLIELSNNDNVRFHCLRRKFLDFMDNNPPRTPPEWGALNVTPFDFRLCSSLFDSVKNDLMSPSRGKTPITVLSSAYSQKDVITYPSPPKNFGSNFNFVIVASNQKSKDLYTYINKLECSKAVHTIQHDHPSSSCIQSLISLMLNASLGSNFILVKKCISSANCQNLIYKKLKYIYPACTISYLDTTFPHNYQPLSNCLSPTINTLIC